MKFRHNLDRIQTGVRQNLDRIQVKFKQNQINLDFFFMFRQNLEENLEENQTKVRRYFGHNSDIVQEKNER